MPEINFDPDGHVYRVDGSIWSSVTQDLESCGLTCFDIVPTDVLEEARRRGKYTHAAACLIDEGDYDREYTAGQWPQYVGYIDAYEKFVEDSGFKPRRTEQIVLDETFGIIGTLDREGEVIDRDWLRFYGAPMPEEWDAFLLDLKTGAFQPGTALQLAGYDFCLPKERRLRMSIHLRPDGTYKPKFFYGPSDKYTYLAAHQVVQWKMRNLK